MARHEHAHEVLRLAIGVVAGDHDLIDLARIEVADGALYEAAFLVDELRRGGAERQLAHVLPEPQQVFEVALDLALGAVGAGGAQDDAHAFRNFELRGDRLQSLAVERRGDLPGDAAAACGIRHEHGIATGEREIGGERCALVAALLLDDLYQQHLAALDDLLDLVLARARLSSLRQFLERVLGAYALDLLVLASSTAVDAASSRPVPRQPFRHCRRAGCRAALFPAAASLGSLGGATRRRSVSAVRVGRRSPRPSGGFRRRSGVPRRLGSDRGCAAPSAIVAARRRCHRAPRFPTCCGGFASAPPCRALSRLRLPGVAPRLASCSSACRSANGIW